MCFSTESKLPPSTLYCGMGDFFHDSKNDFVAKNTAKALFVSLGVW